MSRDWLENNIFIHWKQYDINYIIRICCFLLVDESLTLSVIDQWLLKQQRTEETLSVGNCLTVGRKGDNIRKANSCNVESLATTSWVTQSPNHTTGTQPIWICQQPMKLSIKLLAQNIWWNIPSGLRTQFFRQKSRYPLVNIQTAIENGHL